MSTPLTDEEIQVLAFVRKVKRTFFTDPKIQAIAARLWDRVLLRREKWFCDWSGVFRIYYSMTHEGNALYNAIGKPSVTEPLEKETPPHEPGIDPP